MLPLLLSGIPWDRKSSFLQGPALAPGRIRATLHNGSGNNWTELGFDPLTHPLFRDGGDFLVNDYWDIESEADKRLAEGVRLLSLGGDHSVTYPLIRAYRRHFEPFSILHIDAHGDLYDNYEGDRYSHACPFARIMEEGLAQRLVQVGIRTLTPHLREQAKRVGVEIFEMKDIQGVPDIHLEGPVYISLDLDGLDPAFAPGVSHHEPGGLSSRQVLDIIHRIQVPIIGADIVEYNPHRDVSDMTAALAAKLLKEIAGKMLGG